MSAITRTRTAMYNLNREHLMMRMNMEDVEYARITADMFELLDRMEKEESE